MTLYGLVEVVQGPGMGFTQLVAPFKLTNDLLELDDARAYSPSLGMTAKGKADLARNRCDVQGTIVPAYFFNSLLGGIPFVGRLFSPERGGGVILCSVHERVLAHERTREERDDYDPGSIARTVTSRPSCRTTANTCPGFDSGQSTSPRPEHFGT